MPDRIPQTIPQTQADSINAAREFLWELANGRNRALRERAIKALQGYPSSGDVARLLIG